MYGIPRTSLDGVLMTLDDSLNCKIGIAHLNTDDSMELRDVLNGKQACVAFQCDVSHNQFFTTDKIIIFAQNGYCILELPVGEARLLSRNLSNPRYCVEGEEGTWARCEMFSDKDFIESLNNKDVKVILESFQKTITPFNSRRRQVIDKIIEASCGEL